MGALFAKVKPGYTVLPSHMSGGPMGLGDPDDQTLRKLELDVVIPEKIRRISRQEKCVDLVKDFNKCGKEAALMIMFKCEPQRKELVDCLVKWFQDPDFVKECTEKYLEQRSIYRRTGTNVEQQERLENVREEARKEFWEKWKQENPGTELPKNVNLGKS